MSLLGSVLGSVEHGLSEAGGFVKGVGEGAWDGVKGTVSGVGHLAEDGYKIATDSQYREQAWNSAVNDAKAAANFAATAVTDPGKAADEIGNTASRAWHALETAYNQAASRGQGDEFIGQIFGQGAVLVGTAVIPGGAEADAVGAIGDAGRATALLGDAGKLVDAGKVATITGDASKAAAITGDASKAAAITGDASKAAAITGDASKAAVERGLEEADKTGEAVAKSEGTAARTEQAGSLHVRGRSPGHDAVAAGAIDKAFAGARDEFPGGIPPKILNPKLAEKVHDISNADYAVTYSGVSRTPLVSSEYITKESIEQAANTGRRTNDFRADLRLPADERSELSDYKGFIHVDRGHMAPHGDMSTRAAGSESFLLSNMVPQAANQNEGVWERIESAVRAATGAGDPSDAGRDIYVATGPAFIGDDLQSLNGRVLIPTDTWKAVYIPDENKMGVYWVPNTNTVSANDIETISINELQRRIGIDVFPSVTDPALRDQAEVPPIAEQGRFGGRIRQHDASVDDLTKHN
jgi:endonuclease G, mitochondrial